jgi:hypothetical protein
LSSPWITTSPPPTFATISWARRVASSWVVLGGDPFVVLLLDGSAAFTVGGDVQIVVSHGNLDRFASRPTGPLSCPPRRNGSTRPDQFVAQSS